MSPHAAHGEAVPRAALLAIGLLLASVIAIIGAVRLSGVEVRVPDAAAVRTRALHFEDTADGGIAVIDARLQQTVATLNGAQGFVRGALRALVRERRLRGLDQAQPFLLIGRADGRLTLHDPATDQRIDLESFGPMHAGAFAALLDGAL